MKPLEAKLEANLIIRPARTDEAPVVLNLWQMSARWLNARGIYQWRPEHFYIEKVIRFMSDGSAVYLAELDSKYVGTYVITWADPYIWQELDSLEAGYIHKFAVNRDYQGRGIGSVLLQSAEQQIRQQGRALIRLDCMADNTRLNQYYQEHGYQFVRRLNGDGWGANLYEKN